MSTLLKMLAILVTVYAIEACEFQSSRKCLYFRRKRETIQRVQDVLLEFDIRLTEELANEIKDMNEDEKEQFAQDLGKMNDAVKIETAAVKANGDDGIQTTEEFLRAVSDKVAQDFQGKKWFHRLRSIAGKQIGKLLQDILSHKN